MRRKKVVVVGGCGHVGLPLSIAISEHHEVHIYDINAKAVRMVLRGKMPFKEAGGEMALANALAHGLTASSTPEKISEGDYVVVVTGTPVDEHLNPSIDAFDRVINPLLEGYLRPGQTLVLRSTVYPGTSERLASRAPAGVEVVFCPERVTEGRALEEIRTTPQIISAFSDAGKRAAKELFKPLGVELVEMAPLEAELTKLFNNVYRYINFAVANQFFMVATEYGLDFHRIFHGMTHEYPRAAHMPKPGFAAGPCLFKDTMQLAAFNNNQFFLGHAAMLINEGLPQFVVNHMKKRWELGKTAVGILGMAFKAESDDVRESLSYKLKKILALSAKGVLTTDPYAPGESRDAAAVVARADILVIGTPHEQYRTLDVQEKPVVDIWNLRGDGDGLGK